MFPKKTKSKEMNRERTLSTKKVPTSVLPKRNVELPSPSSQRRSLMETRFPFGRRHAGALIPTNNGYIRRGRNSYMMEQIVLNRLRHIRISSPLNSRNWAVMADELAHRGYMRQSFRCSVIANHIHAPEMDMAASGRRRLSVNRKMASQQNQQQPVKEIHHYHYHLSEPIGSSEDHQIIEDENFHEKKPKATTTTDLMHTKIIADVPVRDVNESDDIQSELIKQNVQKKKRRRRTEKRAVVDEANGRRLNSKKQLKPLRKQYWDICNIVEKRESDLLTAQQELESVQRELQAVRKRWAESLQETVNNMKAALDGGESDLLTTQKQQAWKQRNEYLVKQQEQLLAQIDELNAARKQALEEQQKMKLQLLSEQNKTQQQPKESVQEPVTPNVMKSKTTPPIPNHAVKAASPPKPVVVPPPQTQHNVAAPTQQKSFIFKRGKL